MDPTTVTAALGSIKAATDIGKLITSSSTSLKEAERNLHLANLMSSLAEATVEVAQIQQTLLEKDAEIQKLKEQLAIKESLEWEEPYYWLVDGDKKDGPYCQCCYDNNGKLIRILKLENGGQLCPACKTCYKKSKHTTGRRIHSTGVDL